MNRSRALLIVVSDLHMGGGKDDPWDDFVYQGRQFERMLDKLGEAPEARDGDAELVINGDFLEFAQVRQEAYRLRSSRFWCSEAESVQKLDAIVEGHGAVFDALKQFQSAGNLVTVLPGNHDVDLYWGNVQDGLRAAGGPMEFELATEWISRFNGRVRIGHGHQIDPVNAFAHWDNPILEADDGDRLEMCPGTLFMVKFVNWLERRYPFADNLKPLTSLIPLLLKHDRRGFLAVGWALARFAGRHSIITLGWNESVRERAIGDAVLQNAKYDPLFREGLKADVIKADDDTVAEVLADTLDESDFDRWMALFDRIPPSPTLGTDGGRVTLGMARAQIHDSVARFRDKAEQQWAGLNRACEVVVLGHTHQPDTSKQGRNRYFNPGSWTRYLPYEQMANITFEDLAHEEKFPYQLNVIRIVQRGGEIDATMEPFEENSGARR